jgi:autotransporter-associated beta strand protein
LTISGNLTDGTGTLALAKVMPGTVSLSGANTYTGNTTISAGTLALAATGSISNSANLTLAAGATLDVSAISAFALTSSNTLNAAGTASAATLNGASGGTVNLGSRPIILTYDGTHPALTISQGTLQLSGNAFTVNKATPLASGTYAIVQQTSGNITSAGTYTVTGTAIDSTHYGTIAVSVGNVVLTVALKPTVTGKSYSRAPGTALKIYASDLAATATVDSSLSYTATFDHSASTTANSVTLGNNGQSGNSAILIYPSTAANSADSFSYTINDGHGGTVSGTVTITVNSGATGQATINVAGQSATLGFFGVPGYHYVVQRSVDSLSNWQDLTGVTTGDVTPSGTSVDGNGVITAPSGGAFNVTDSSPPSNPTSVYYQLRAAP